jgi:1-acyl-sn-glycerol-3-phosphate acyltransferase
LEAQNTPAGMTAANGTLRLVLRSLWTHFVVISLVLVLGPIAIVLSPFTRGEIVFVLGRFWSRCILKAAGATLRVDGLEKLRPGVARVLVGNHASNFDIYVLILSLEGHRFRFTPKQEIKYIPIFGWALWAGGFPFIDRRRSARSRRTMAKVAERIRREKLNVVFFPEGTRNTGNELLTFKKGPFVLAIDAQVEVVPFAIHGAKWVQSRHRFLVRPGAIRVELDDPIPTEGLTYEDRGRLTEQARLALERMLGDEKARGIS